MAASAAASEADSPHSKDAVFIDADADAAA